MIDPKSQTIGVGRSIQKVVIVLANIVRWIVNDVRGRLAGIVDDCHCGHRRRAQSNARGIAQVDIESFISFDK